MGISEYENIEIFNNTQSFRINKCENQIIRETRGVYKKIKQLIKLLVWISYYELQTE